MERISFNVAKALKKQDILKDLTHLLSGMTRTEDLMILLVMSI